jgi:cysteine desulfurase
MVSKPIYQDIMKQIYLDNNTSAKPTETIYQGMLPFLKNEFASTSSPYFLGQDQLSHAQKALNNITKLLGAKKEDKILFCSSGAEAQNHVVFSTYLDITRTNGKNHFLSSIIDEAPTILSMHRLEKLGVLVKHVPVSQSGHVTIKEVEEAISPRTAILSLSLACGLTGVICDTYEIQKLCKERSILLHLDLTHVLGKVAIDLHELGADIATFNGQQLHAPKGSGGIWIKEKVELSPFIFGENLNVAALVALGIAAEESYNRLDFMSLEVARLRDYFERKILNEIEGSKVLFQESMRTPSCSCISFEGILNEPLLYLLSQKGVFASFGGGNFQKLSSMLTSMGIDTLIANSALSFSLAFDTTQNDLDEAIAKISSCVKYLKKLRGSL